MTARTASGAIDTRYTGTIQMSSVDPQASFPSSYQFTTADAGVHTFTVTLNTAGIQSIIATDIANPSISGTESNITVKPAAADLYTLTGFPTHRVLPDRRVR